jgi:hypothetical protein
VAGIPITVGGGDFADVNARNYSPERAAQLLAAMRPDSAISRWQQTDLVLPDQDQA